MNDRSSNALEVYCCLAYKPQQACWEISTNNEPSSICTHLHALKMIKAIPLDDKEGKLAMCGFHRSSMIPTFGKNKEKHSCQI
eukprot:15360214-Ditylum_brightwellii.AAC.1